jgi:hypothetical protein
LSDQKAVTVSIARTRQINIGGNFLCWVASDLNVPFEVDILSLSFVVETPIPKAKRSGIGKLNNPAQRRV